MILTGALVGLALGIVMQRGRFCVTGMLRDIFLLKSWRTTVGLFIVIAVHAMGLAALTSAGIITPEYSTFAPLAVVLGGVLFGVGIVLAGGCASGTWYRSGEGLIGSWFALIMYALSAGMMNNGVLAPVNDTLKSWDTGWTTLPQMLGVSPWLFAIPFAALTAYLAVHFLRRERSSTAPVRLQGVPWYKRPLHVYTAGALIGLLGVIAWPLSAASGRNSGLGITTPSSNIATGLVTGDLGRFDWGVMLVLGILVGSFIAARATGEFRLRVPDSLTTLRAVGGGLAMGVGAALAGGCTVGNGMVETSLFSMQGWVALLSIAAGVGLATKRWLVPSAAPAAAASSAADATYSTNDSLSDPSLVAGNSYGGPALAGASVGAASSAASEASAAQAATTAQAPAASLASAAGHTSTSTGAATQITPVNVGLLERDSAVSTKARPLGDGAYALDTLGAVCPFPLIEAKDVMATLSSGERLVIDFDCTQATEAIPRWAADDGHAVTDFHATGDARWQITVEKG